MLDPIADMLTRIRNAQKAEHADVFVPFSKLKNSIAAILVKENFIEDAKKDMAGSLPVLRIILRYDSVSNMKKDPAIREIKRVSRQGQRIYVKKSDIRQTKNGYGISIISTSKGVMTGKDAKRNGLGGEVICEVW